MGLSCVKQKLPKENINDVKNFVNIGIYSKLDGKHSMDDLNFSFYVQVLGYNFINECRSNILGVSQANLISLCQCPLTDKNIQEISTDGLDIKFWLKSQKEGFSNSEEINLKNILKGSQTSVTKILKFDKYSLETTLYLNIGGEYLLKEMMKGELESVVEYYGKSFQFLYRDGYLYDKVKKVKTFNMLTYQYIMAYIKDSLNSKINLENLKKHQDIIDVLNRLTEQLGQEEFLDNEILFHESMEDILFPYRSRFISKILIKKKDEIIKNYFHRVYDLGFKNKFCDDYHQDLLAGEIILHNEKAFLDYFTNEDNLRKIQILPCESNQISQHFMYLFGYPQIRKLLYKNRENLSFKNVCFYTDEDKENHISKNYISTKYDYDIIRDLLEFEFEVLSKSPDEDNFIYRLARLENNECYGDEDDKLKISLERLNYFLSAALLNSTIFSRLNLKKEVLVNIGNNLMKFIHQLCENPQKYDLYMNFDFKIIVSLLCSKHALNNKLVYLFFEEENQKVISDKFSFDTFMYEIVAANLERSTIIEFSQKSKECLFQIMFLRNGYRNVKYDFTKKLKIIDTDPELSDIFISIATTNQNLEYISKNNPYDAMLKLSQLSKFKIFVNENLTLIEETFKDCYQKKDIISLFNKSS